MPTPPNTPTSTAVGEDRETESKLGHKTIPLLKDKSTGEPPLQLGMLKTVYQNAVEFTTRPEGSRGMTLFWLWFAAGIALFTALYFIRPFLFLPMEGNEFFYWIVIVPSFVCALLFGIVFFIFGIRVELFQPLDEPILFDRKNQKLYYLRTHGTMSWKDLLPKPLQVQAFSYDWKRVDGRYHRKLVTAGSSAQISYMMELFVRQNDYTNEMQDMVALSRTAHDHSEATILSIWEYIRRYMHADGDPLMDGKAFARPPKRKGFWECINMYNAFSKKNRQADKLMPVLSLLLTPLMIILIPMTLSWSILAWLSYLTAQPAPKWPQHILDAVGEPLYSQNDADAVYYDDVVAQSIDDIVNQRSK